LFVFPGFPPSPLFALAPARAILYVHDLFLLTRRDDLNSKARYYMRPAFALAVRRLRHFLVNSEKTRAELRAVCRNDASIDLYRPDVANVFALEPRKAAGPVADRTKPLRLIALGTVEPRKNYGAAVRIRDALERLGYERCELHIIGRQGWGEAAQALAATKSVVMRGFLSAQDVRSIIAQSDIYLCTSHDEGLGLPLLEVQYSGLPVVAPNAPVFHEVLGTSGIFIDPAAPDAAAAIIDAALTGKSRAAQCDRSIANVERWSASVRGDKAAVVARLDQLSERLHPQGCANQVASQ
jgi:glycosyltransferase involved in cell wall biosynthesis